MAKRHYIPEGEVIFIPSGKYRFVGPMWVDLDPSFKWPPFYESGKIIHYGEKPKKKRKYGSKKQSNTKVRSTSEATDSSASGESVSGLGGSELRDEGDSRSDSSEIGKD